MASIATNGLGRIGRAALSQVRRGQRLAGIVSRGDVVALLTIEWVCLVCGEAARGRHPHRGAQSATPTPAGSSCRTPSPRAEEASR